MGSTVKLIDNTVNAYSPLFHVLFAKKRGQARKGLRPKRWVQSEVSQDKSQLYNRKKKIQNSGLRDDGWWGRRFTPFGFVLTFLHWYKC